MFHITPKRKRNPEFLYNFVVKRRKAHLPHWSIISKAFQRMVSSQDGGIVSVKKTKNLTVG